MCESAFPLSHHVREAEEEDLLPTEAAATEREHAELGRALHGLGAGHADDASGQVGCHLVGLFEHRAFLFQRITSIIPQYPHWVLACSTSWESGIPPWRDLSSADKRSREMAF